MPEGLKNTLARQLRPIARPFARYLWLLVIADVFALLLAWFMTWAAPKSPRAGMIMTESWAGVTYVRPWVPGFEHAVYVATACLLACFAFFAWLYSGEGHKPKV